MIGIRVQKTIGVGDAVQFTSVPENWFRHSGEKTVDVEGHWIFDHNPYVVRGDHVLDARHDMWYAHCHQRPGLWPRSTVMLSNAESHACSFGYRVTLNRPRLYAFEAFPYEQREDILLHVKGNSHGQLPEHVVRHVMDKYGARVKWVGLREEWVYNFPPPIHVPTKTLWDLAEVVSRARMFIGPDSGPSWIAQCYPDVIVKKVRLIPGLEELHKHVPLEWCRLNSHWDDRSAMFHNPSEDDVGFTWSYKRI